MPKGYRHLTYEIRCQLFTLNERNLSLTDIAKELDIHRSTVSRELRRNAGRTGYQFKEAHQLAINRRSAASSHKHKMTAEMTELIERKLRIQWSPDQISGWIRAQQDIPNISHELIYQYVWKDKREGGCLFKQLRHYRKKGKKRGAAKSGRSCIPNRVDIKERPQIANDKGRLGDWEVDTIFGKDQKGAIVSIVDRRSKLTKLVLVPRKTAKQVGEAICDKLKEIKYFVHTITADNGPEFASHERVSQILGTQFFFATPYHSWERGLNEHTNGLIRQYLPKGSSFETVTDGEIENIELLLNNRPRKVLGYMTPIEAFDELSRQSTLVAL
jgi:IS30 family transposase